MSIRERNGDKANGARRGYHVIGGNGTYSYSKNSEYQKQLVDLAKGNMLELIGKHLDLDNPAFDPRGSIRIADFGCSVGPNTFVAVQNIIEAIVNRFQKINSDQDSPAPHFLIFLNDLVDNDFNSLFRNLPHSKQYYAAAVPGSFHGQLLPKATLHIAHCSTALHWVSKIPMGVTDKSSPAWNKRKVHYFGAAKAVNAAYSTQFKQDMEAFLSARAQELVAGGLMIIIINGYPDDFTASQSIIAKNFNILESCLADMVKMEIVTEEKMDQFNLPFYFPTPSELKTCIEANGYFQIEKLEKLDFQMDQKCHEKADLISIAIIRLRAIIGGLIAQHFGDDIVDPLFRLFTHKYFENPVIFDDKYRQVDNYFVFLKRLRMEQNV